MSVIDKYLSKYFLGEAFEDALFNEENNIRELACSWKIMSTTILFGELLKLGYESWLWRGIGLPLHLADPSLQGDIDLMFALRRGEPQNGRVKFIGPVYRCFELKTSKVTRNGDVKSLKEGKFHKTKAQLEKLCKIGAPEVHLLEAFIIEAGFSTHPEMPAMPAAVRESIARKYNQIVGTEFGYVALPMQQMLGFDEQHTRLMWPTERIKHASISQLRPPFSNLVAAVEAHLAIASKERGYSPVVGYCADCKSLTCVHQRGPYVCEKCEAPLV